MRFVKEKFKYLGQETLPSFWKPYFSKSIVGQEYTVLRDLQPNVRVIKQRSAEYVETEDLIMSNTEYEYFTNEPFFELCRAYNQPKVLSVGYGIGLILPEMEKQHAQLTIIEKYQEVLDLEESIESIKAKHTIIVSDFNKIDLASLGKYDVIFIDFTEDLLHTHESLSELLTNGGKICYWRHNLPIDFKIYN
jgi:hypothetical protein